MKIQVYNFTFQQSQDDIETMCKDLNVDDISDLDDDQIVEYLKQWDNGIDTCDSNLYDADQLDSEFLGYRLDSDNETEGYLFSRDDSLGYVGLSYFKKVE